jgi:hypothetical protein
LRKAHSDITATQFTVCNKNQILWNKEELPEKWKESIMVPIHKKGNKTDCNNYRGISLSPTTYKILSNILLSGLIPYAEEIMGGSSMWIPTQ